MARKCPIARREYNREYATKNRARIYASRAAYRKKHPEIARARSWHNTNPDADRAYRKAYRAEVRQQVIEGYGGKCACCGVSEPKFLAIDHVNNDGHKERKVFQNLFSFHRHIIKSNFPPEYQLLCHNCNCAKGFYGACPHTESQ